MIALNLSGIAFQVYFDFERNSLKKGITVAEFLIRF